MLPITNTLYAARCVQYTSRAAQLYRAMLEKETTKITPQAAVAALHW